MKAVLKLRPGAAALVGCASLLASVTVSSSADAAGLYFSDRGVRGLARGGAFIAGADDAGAIYYNPAGLSYAGEQFLFDASWLRYQGTYRRQSELVQTDPNTGDPTGATDIYTHPEVEGTSPILPIPTLAYSNPLGLDDKGFNFAIGLWAPYAAITSYPETVGGRPAPQRYSLLTLDGSALAIAGLYASYQPIEELSFGLGVEMLAGFFEASVAFSACVPDRFLCAPEQPDYDAATRLRVGPITAPSGVAGIIVSPIEDLRLGLSYHLPFNIESEATVDVRLPSAAVFDSASQGGNKADVQFDLPSKISAGIEYRGLPNTRIETAFVYEPWSVHDAITLKPRNITLNNVEAFPPEYELGQITLERGFQDAWSWRLGGEYSLDLDDYILDMRAGFMYETSAIPPEYLSATTVDLDKIVIGLGGGLHIGKWRFDGLIAFVMGQQTKVSTDEAQIAQVLPLRANPPERENYINAGTYEASALVLGVGLRYQFDSPAEAPTKPEPGSGTFKLKKGGGLEKNPDEPADTDAPEPAGGE